MSAPTSPSAPEPTDATWTGAIRRLLERRLPLAHLLPVRQPFFVGSWVYVFGVVAITALIWVIGSGVVLAFFGPGWWHVSGIGRFVNSIHFWAVQVFFVFVVLHLWGQYFMASWRNGRATTWIVGVVIFIVGLVTGFTGYVSQQNLDAQWIAINAKDGINATGAGAFFNVLDFGQMYGIHVMLLPILVTTLVVLHVVQVRMRGVVRPIEAPSPVDGGGQRPDTTS
ncbi:MAG: cytochrome b N-terminal domain-containing protein [Candidatus Limnocylindrales bacterium]